MSIHYYSCINDSPHTLIMELNMQAYFDQLDRVRYEGPKTTNPLGRVRISTLRNENETFSQLNSITYIGVFLRLVTYSHLP